MSENTKAAARSTLAGLAETRCNQTKVKELNDFIKNGEIGIMDYVCECLEAIHDLSEEFVAWGETCDGDQYKCRARQRLRKFAELLVRPVSEPARIEGEYETCLDIVRNFYLNNDAETCAMLGIVVTAIHDLRTEIIAGAERWGMSA